MTKFKQIQFETFSAIMPFGAFIIISRSSKPNSKNLYHLGSEYCKT